MVSRESQSKDRDSQATETTCDLERFFLMGVGHRVPRVTPYPPIVQQRREKADGEGIGKAPQHAADEAQSRRQIETGENSLKRIHGRGIVRSQRCYHHEQRENHRDQTEGQAQVERIKPQRISRDEHLPLRFDAEGWGWILRMSGFVWHIALL